MSVQGVESMRKRSVIHKIRATLRWAREHLSPFALAHAVALAGRVLNIPELEVAGKIALSIARLLRRNQSRGGRG
jgi:hypothetical protein